MATEIDNTTIVKKPSKEFFKALDALNLDFSKLQSKVDRVFEIGRNDGLDDMKIGDYVRARMDEHYSEKTIRNVLPTTAKHVEKTNKHNAVEITAPDEPPPSKEFAVNSIICGDSLSVLKTWKDSESVDCCITSPPYYMARDYEVDGQLGRETSHTEYVDKLVQVFSEVNRVLKDTGSCWIVIGDSFDGKGLLCIPERLSTKMLDTGDWILRGKIIWKKRNATPHSAKNRFTPDWEYVFFFVKSDNYYFETQYEPHNPKYAFRYKTPFGGYNNKSGQGSFNYTKPRMLTPNPKGRIKRSVWDIPVETYKGAHFAVFPTKLIEPIVRAGCPENGVILDPFIGSGTTGVVALQNAWQFVGIELNNEYVKMANKRIQPYLNQVLITV